MKPEEFRAQAHKMVDWMADYLETVSEYPVKSQVKPREVFEKIPLSPPQTGEDFDDIIVDTKRYRYGGSIRLAKIFRFLIPKPDLYFVLIASSEIIYSRKREVEFDELNKQIMNYRKLCDGKKYIEINVDNTPEKITNKITTYLMRKMNERY